MTTTIQANVPFLNARTGIYTAWQLRNLGDQDPPGPGAADYESFRVLQRQAGANLSVDIGKTTPGLMRAWIRGGTRGGQGLYIAENMDYTAPTADTYLAQINEAGFTAADPTNPRIDQVILEVLDQQHAGASNVLQTRVVTGTATGGATLDNRTGAAATPAGCILLADCLIPAAATTVTTANIRDRRPFPLFGTIPPTTAAATVDQVMFVPHPSTPAIFAGVSAQASFDTAQSAALMFLPRRIVGATRIRWKYQQASTANAANYVISICDASGRPIVSIAPVAYTGALNTWQVRSETIAATTFEAGAYYVFMGSAAATAASGVNTYGVAPALVNGSQIGALAPNTVFRAAAGGTTVPATILAMTDASTLTAGTLIPCIPIFTLSVG